MSADPPYVRTHRVFYDAIESGDIDLMASLWVDDPSTSCVHPGSLPVRGTPAVLRSWTLLMASVGYIQFFLTDVQITLFPLGADAEHADIAVITCTENILAADGAEPLDSFTGGHALSTSLLVRDRGTGAGTWKFWSRHASPLAERSTDLEEDV